MKMIIRQICFVAAVFVSTNAYAQRCDVDAEAIFKLREASMGAFAIWDGVHGSEDLEERYDAAVLMDNGFIVAVGTRASLGKPFPELILAEIDRRGRVTWESKRSVKGLEQVLGAERAGKDIIVTARIQEGRDIQSIWVGFFNEKGALRQERTFRHKKGSLVYGDVIPVSDGKGFVMVASTKDKRSAAPRFSEFYRLNSKGQLISKRAFNPGPDNGLYRIVPTKDGEYLALGYVNNARGRKTGWLLKIDGKGGIVWQRQYPRGIGAELSSAAEMPDGSIVVLGTALPAQEDALKAGWLMQLDPSNGEMRWQRYFTDELDYTGKDLEISADGLISVLLDAKPVKGSFDDEGEKRRDYSRLVTLNPRGVIFDSQAYFQGEIADAQDMVIGPARERIIVGATQIAYQKDTDEVAGDDAAAIEGQPIVKRSFEGWAVAAPKAQDYVDPCKPKKERVLKTL